MKWLVPLLLFHSFSSWCQVNNPGFEAGLTDRPDWENHTTADFTITLQSSVVHSGRSALEIDRPGNPGDWQQGGFSQHITINSGKNQSVEISAWIKTEKCTGNVTLTCETTDQQGKRSGSFTARMLGLRISDDNDWKKYTLRLLLTPDIAALDIGGSLAGSGTAWFDDFELQVSPLTAAGPPSKAVKKYLAKTIAYVKARSIYKDSLDWAALTPALTALTAGMQSTAECYPVIDNLVARLGVAGDNHSQFLRPDAVRQMNAPVSNNSLPSGSFIEGGIAYVSVPRFLSTNDTAVRAFATRLQDIIRDLDTQHEIKGWLIDLRENSGGNMYAMLAGLGPLCGEDTLGFFYGSAYKMAWKYRNGAAYAGKTKMAEVKNPYRVKNPAAKIAVLIGPKTASSGEMTAVSFSSLAGVRFFGRPSGGFTTSNGNFILPDGATLLVANGFIMDRTMKKFTGKIKPDTESPGKEKVPAEAASWLLGK